MSSISECIENARHEKEKGRLEKIRKDAELLVSQCEEAKNDIWRCVGNPRSNTLWSLMEGYSRTVVTIPRHCDEIPLSFFSELDQKYGEHFNITRDYNIEKEMGIYFNRYGIPKCSIDFKLKSRSEK